MAANCCRSEKSPGAIVHEASPDQHSDATGSHRQRNLQVGFSGAMPMRGHSGQRFLRWYGHGIAIVKAISPALM